MITTHLKRGLVAGLVGGLVNGLFLAIVGNSLIALAEGFEHSHGHHEAAVSGATTTVLSIGAGVLWGVLFGMVVFGGAYYLLEPVIPGGEGTRSYLLGAAGFLTVSGVPWLVLPPQAPGMEQALPTETRTILYAGLMVLGLVVCGLAATTYTRLRARGRNQAQALAVSLAPFALVVVPVVLAPANPVHGPVPAKLVTVFQSVVVFGQLALWGTLATAHAWLTSRADTQSVSVSSTAYEAAD